MSLAAAAFTEDGNTEIHSIYNVIKPDGWTIKPGAQEKHLISQEFAEQNGIDIRVPLLHLAWLASMSRLILSYNWNFDKRMILREIALHPEVPKESFDVTKGRCIMLASAATLKLPNEHGFDSYKWPKLEEAYEFVFQKKMEGAHNAMFDLRASAFLAFALRDLNYWDMDKTC